MRSKKDLEQLYEQLRNFCVADLGVPFRLEDFKQAFNEMTQKRLAHFLFRRIGHIPDADYLNFIALISGNPNPLMPEGNQTMETPVVEKEVIQESPPDNSTPEEDAILIEKLQNLGKKRGRPGRKAST